MFPTTTQQTTQTVRQTTLNWKMQTITQQTHTKPLCWPPAYQASLVSHASLLPSLSRILVDHLKENPHLLTPVHPAKRRRVEHEVNDCDAVVLDKVKVRYGQCSSELLLYCRTLLCGIIVWYTVVDEP